MNGFARGKLRDLRIQRGMTQEDLALRLGVGPSTVRAWETGRIEPTAENFARLIKLLRVPAKALLNSVSPLRGLAEHRRRAGISQQEAADKADLPLHRVREIERGVRPPSAAEARALGRAYRIKASEVTELAQRLHDHRTHGGRA